MYPFFLVTIPGTFILHMDNYYHLLLDWKLVIYDIIICIAVPVIIYIIFRRSDKYRRKTGVLLFWSMVVFYFFHVLHDWLKKLPVLTFLSSYSVLLPILAISGFLLVRQVIKAKHSFNRLYYTGNLIFGLLFFGGFGELIYLGATTDITHHDLADPEKKLVKQFTPCDTCARPDIYFIILDGYTNSKTLQQEFNYNNDWITRFLKKNNFFVVENSKSNYYFTQISLASILDMDYLRRLDTDKLFHTREFFQAHYTIYNNELCDILKKQGYAINNYSIFDLKDHPSLVEPFLQELTPRSIIGQTFFHKLNRDIGYHWNGLFRKKKVSDIVKRADIDIKRMDQTYQGILRATRSDTGAPKFTFAHFVLPHETFYYDSSGKKTDIAAIVQRGYTPSDYISQVAFTNRHVIVSLVEKIITRAKRPFVIILQGDHGYRSYPPEKLHLEFENFNAICFSNGRYDMLKDSMSSVNTFRVVLNQFFNAQLPLLKDSSIYLKKRVMMPN